MSLPAGVEVRGPVEGRHTEVLTDDALEFVAGLHRKFETTRQELLSDREQRQARLNAGERFDFFSTTKGIRDRDWTVAEIPRDLADRRVEITGPTDRKMVINALNSGARLFMADFEDSNVPLWQSMLDGQVNLIDAISRSIDFTSPEGKRYELNDDIAVLKVRPRGWHLDERHLVVDGRPVSGGLFDFALYFFHNARSLLEKGTGPYFYLPKLETHQEARLWNDIFVDAQSTLGIPTGSIKATVLIETISAAFEMDEILYELRDHITGLNAGRWDYIFSIIKRFRTRDDILLPDRAQVVMTVPFMRAYTELLVKTCHRRRAHAMGGMAAFVPSRKTPEINEGAIQKVREDKQREAGDGFDGTWVAHPDLVAAATEEFDAVLGARPNQVDRDRSEVAVAAADLQDFVVPGGSITEDGVRNNVNVGLRYLESWLRGSGAVTIFNLMEDSATAEIARAQIWQWIRHRATLDDGRVIDESLVQSIEEEELDSIRDSLGAELYERGRFKEAQALFERVALEESFPEFLTMPGLEYID